MRGGEKYIEQTKNRKSKMGKKQGRCRSWVWGSRKSCGHTPESVSLTLHSPVPVPVTLDT